MIPPPHHDRDHAEDQKRKGGNAEQFPHGTKPSMTANWGCMDSGA
jgi:hypothetical protein